MSRPWPRSGVMILLVVAVVGAAMPLLIPGNPLALLVAVSFVVSLVPIFAVLLGRKWDAFEPSVWFMASYWVLFVIRPIADVLSPSGPAGIAGLDPTPTYGAALALATAGALGLYVGYYTHFGSRLARAMPRFDFALSLPRLGVLAVVASIIALGLFGLFIVLSGGLPALATLLSGRNEYTLELLSGTGGYLFSGPLWLVGIAVLQLAVTERWRSAPALAALAVLGIGLVVAAPTGARSWTLAAASAVYVLYYIRRNRRPTMRALAALLVMVFFVGITAHREFRDSAVREGSYVDAVVGAVTEPGRAVEEFVLGLDTAMVATFAIELQHVPDFTPHRMGSTYVAALARPLPRAFWPEKPREGDTELMAVIWPDLARSNVQFTFSLFGEPYFNFGAVGVVAVMFLFGICYRAVYEWFLSARDSPVVQALFAVSLPMMYVYVRGGLGFDYHRHAILILPILLAAWWARTRTTSQATEAPNVAAPLRHLPAPK